MAYKKNRTIIQGTALHKDMLNIAREGYSGNNLPDGRHASGAFQKKDSAFMSNKFVGELMKAREAGDKTFTVDNKTYDVEGGDKPLPMTEDVAMKMKSAYKKDSFTPEQREKLQRLAKARNKVKPGEMKDYMDKIKEVSGGKIKSIEFDGRTYS